jgi:small subunit ribosomal protein S6
MRTYEVLFILSPQVTEEEATNLIADFKSIAEKNGATLKNEEAWGRRRLAYPIHKSNEGIYHLFVLESDSSLSELDRRMKNVDRVLRHVIVRTDLEHKRAAKLAQRNPKKERVRPSSPMSPMQPMQQQPPPQQPQQPQQAPAAEPPVESAMATGADEAAPQA